MAGDQRHRNNGVVFAGIMITTLVAVAVTWSMWHKSKKTNIQDDFMATTQVPKMCPIECGIFQDDKEKYLRSTQVSYESDTYVHNFVKHYTQLFSAHVAKHNINVRTITTQEARELILQLAKDSCNVFAQLQNTVSSLTHVNDVRIEIMKFLFSHNCLERIDKNSYKTEESIVTIVSDAINISLQDPSIVLGVDVGMFGLIYAAHINSKYTEQAAHEYIVSTLTQMVYSPHYENAHARTIEQKGTFLNKLVLLNDIVDFVFWSAIEHKNVEQATLYVQRRLGQAHTMQLLSQTSYIAQFFLDEIIQHKIVNTHAYLEELIELGRAYGGTRIYADFINRKKVNTNIVVGFLLSFDKDRAVLRQAQTILTNTKQLRTEDLQLLLPYTVQYSKLNDSLKHTIHSLWELEHCMLKMYMLHNNLTHTAAQHTRGTLSQLHKTLHMSLNKFNTQDVAKLEKLFSMKDLTRIVYSSAAHPGKILTMLDLDSKTGELHANTHDYKALVSNSVYTKTVNSMLKILWKL